MRRDVAHSTGKDHVPVPTQEDRIAALVGLGSCPPNERLRIGATIPMKICQQRKLQVDEWIMEIGGGLNFKSLEESDRR